MNLLELLNRCKPNTVKVQRLVSCMEQASIGKKHGKIKFRASNELTQSLLNDALGQDAEYVGFVVWVKKDQITENDESTPIPEG